MTWDTLSEERDDSIGWTMRSNKQLVNELRAAPAFWMDTAIVVAFENRFEFVGEDHPDPLSRLNFLQEQGGFAIGLAGMKPGVVPEGTLFSAQLFHEFKGQRWAQRYMDILRGIVRRHATSE